MVRDANKSPQELLDRKPPADEKIEQAFLGSVILKPDVLQTMAVRPADFYLQEHQILFETITTMYRAGQTIDAVTLASRLKAATANDVSAFEMVGGAHGLGEIINGVPTAHNAAAYGERIRDLAESRRLLNLGIDIILSVYNGESTDEMRQQIRDAYETVTRSGVEFNAITCAELDAGQYETEFLIEHTLVAGQPCIIAGGKKSLKTSIMIDLAITLATGGFFLGRLKATRPARVLMMSGESGKSTIQETARRIAHAAGRRLEDIANLAWSFELPRFGNLAHMDALSRIIKSNQSEVLMLDPAYLCMPAADAANLMAQGELLRGVSDVCQDAGAMMVLAHHTRKTGKPNPFDPPELEDIAWAGFQEFARQWFLIGRRERYEPGTGEHRVWLNVGGSAGHSAMWAVDIEEGVYDPDRVRRWDVSVLSAGEARKEQARQKERKKCDEKRQQDEQHKRKVLEILKRYPDGETKRTLRDLTDLNNKNMSTALDLLDREGRAEPCKVEKANGRKYDGWKPTTIGLGHSGTQRDN